MSKIFTFRAKSITLGTVSIEAETIEEAREKRKELLDADLGALNIELGAGEMQIDATGHEDNYADDGNHYMQTPRENAIENAALLKEIE